MAEFARLYNLLEEQGKLENTWLVLTSDHDEMFERGIIRHSTPVLHQPVTHIPLIIFPPGQIERTDIFEATSAIDLLPSLMHVTGQDIPNWVEGNVLPPYFESSTHKPPPIFAFEAEYADKFKPLDEGTAMIVEGDYKLIYFFGYEELGGDEMIELYNITVDPEELSNLYPSRSDIADDLLKILKDRTKAADAPYL